MRAGRAAVSAVRGDVTAEAPEDAADAVRAALADRGPLELAQALGCSRAAVRAWRDGWRTPALHVALAVAALERGIRRQAWPLTGGELRAEMDGGVLAW